MAARAREAGWRRIGVFGLDYVMAVRDYRALGEKVWDRFSASAEDNLWYYRDLVEAFRQPDRTALFAELERVVGELEAERRKALEGR